MTIINDRENNKTIDTETGMYLTRVKNHSYSSYVGFELHDGSTILYIGTTRKAISQSKNKNLVVYIINLISKLDGEQGSLLRRDEHLNYKLIIQNFIKNYKDYHGLISVRDVDFQVDFTHFEETLAKREASNV